MATVNVKGSKTITLAAFSTDGTLHKNLIDRPKPNDSDVHIEIAFCGLCHSDLHSTAGEWGHAPSEAAPLSPGHEIAGHVIEVGKNVTKFKKGDRVGVGCFIGHCGNCGDCKDGEEQYCPKHLMTYASVFPEGMGHDECKGVMTQGGYSQDIVVPEHWVFRIPDSLELKFAAPLLCAGATTYAPLARNFLGKGLSTVGIVGFGGLGHVAAKIAKAMGAKVTMLSRNKNKQKHADEIGVGLAAYTDAAEMKGFESHFDLIMDTVSEPHDLMCFLPILKARGTLVLLGGIPKPFQMSAFGLLVKGIKVEGSLVAGAATTQEMLDFCAKHNVLPDIDLIKASEASAAYAELHKGATSKRYVMDSATLKDLPDEKAADEKKN